ncbi:MAG TPA: cell filamentation protein Fic [Bacteroidetes bacterium]|nr:cell filamentation protein Fic [Bacteroidota bacterium]
MGKPRRKLAESLEILRALQHKKHLVAIKATEISRTHQERLLRNGFLKTVSKGWFIATNPSEKQGDSTSWYTSYWQFCARFLASKFGKKYCVSAEQSILIHAGNRTVPQQMIVRAAKGSNSSIELLHNTSLYVMQSTLPKKAEITVVDGIRVLDLPFALIHCSPVMYEQDPIEMRTVLALVTDASEILAPLLSGSHSVVAGRLAGAFRNIGRDRIADEIVKTMRAADYKVWEVDPFKGESHVSLGFRERSPYANRLKLTWKAMREEVIAHFPKEPGLSADSEQYLRSVDEIYVTDAYHSLSIERYTVSAELIEQVRSGEWSLENEADRKQRDAMAARGYWQAAQAVKKSIGNVLAGANAGFVGDREHGDWYRELFAPSVALGLLAVSDLAGYRVNQVFITNSMHVPMSKDAVRDAMPVLFELLSDEPHAGVRAVLGHFIFVYIHPYMDGNGRMGRFLMNVMLASGGYPWTVIPVQERENYMKALERASVENDIAPFAKFIGDLVQHSLDGSPVAKLL